MVSCEDNVQVKQYRIYLDDQLVQRVDADSTAVTIGGLQAKTHYHLSVEGQDAAGNRSNDGPQIMVSTLDG